MKYFVIQKISIKDGTPVNKPVGLFKCSHGGVLDESSIFNSSGGINKDSGYTLLSPHANLHLKAAELAINHTELFFENIRQEIGDKEFANFLQLQIDNKTLISSINTVFCAAFLFFYFILFWLFFY